MTQKQDSAPNFTKSKVEKTKGHNANQSFTKKKKKLLKNSSFEVMDSIVKSPIVKSSGLTGDSLHGRSKEKKRKTTTPLEEKEDIENPERECGWDVLSKIVKSEITRLETIEKETTKPKKQAGDHKKRKRDKDELHMNNSGGNMNQSFGSKNKMETKPLSKNLDQSNPDKLSKRARRKLNKRKSLEKKDKDDLNYIPLVTKTLNQSISEISPSKVRDKSSSKNSSAKNFATLGKGSQKERSILSSMSEDESDEENEMVTKKVNKLNKPSNIQKNKHFINSANTVQNIPKSDSENDNSVEEAESSDDEESEEENINTQIQSNLQNKFLNQKTSESDSSDVEDESDDDDEGEHHIHEKNQLKQFDSSKTTKKNTQNAIQSIKKSALKRNGEAVSQMGKEDSDDDEEESEVEADDFIDDEAEEGEETEGEDESDNEIEDPSESPSKKFKSSPTSDNNKRFDGGEVVNKVFISNLPKE